jgi:hypothetical protein
VSSSGMEGVTGWTGGCWKSRPKAEVTWLSVEPDSSSKSGGGSVSKKVSSSLSMAFGDASWYVEWVDRGVASGLASRSPE